MAEAAAAPELAARRLAPAKPIAVEAIAARAVARLRAAGALGRFTPIGERPGLAAALARTVEEVRLAAVPAEQLPADLARLVRSFADELDAAHLADPPAVLALAAASIRAGRPFPWCGAPAVWVDLPVRSRLEAELLAALAQAAGAVLAVAPIADERSVRALEECLGVPAEALDTPEDTALGRLQARLFGESPPPTAVGAHDVEIFSAPGEERECAEIARRVLRAAGEGIRFDRAAILLRHPSRYRLPLEEALERAGIPAWWSQGTEAPDPAGRAFLAVLACRAEGLSARRFAEAISLGESPGELRSPRRWERLLVESAVIGGIDRWRRRLHGLEAELARDDPARAEQRLAHLRALRAFALPVVESLAALPEEAPWRVWLPALAALATQALRDPARVLDALDGLRVLGPVDATLAEVRRALAEPLLAHEAAPPARRYGRVFVGPVHAARGMDFDLVLVAGLGERIFPTRAVEDPLLLDVDRAGLPLANQADRRAEERLLLHLAVGAASRRLALSWPRLELEQLRARGPSVYVLDVVRAVEGHVPDVDAVAALAAAAGAAPIAWPAPAFAEDAIDEVEYDLAVLRELLVRPTEDARGGARWLLEASPHLRRSLRARWSRWSRAVREWDGLYARDLPAVREALAPLHPSLHPWAATHLERHAECPYQLYLRGVLRLAAREEPARVEHLGPAARGSFFHEVAWRVLVELREGGRLPLRAAGLDDARVILDRHVDAVARRWHDEQYPAIERVWRDEIARLRADLREWLARLAEEPAWTPFRMELAFGLPPHARADRDSRADPLSLPIGLVLRGSVDLVERRADGALRVTDYKTGRIRPDGEDDPIGGGRRLQPVLYALACEALFPGARVEAARLWHVTARAGFEEVACRVDGVARHQAREAVGAIGRAFTAATFLADPSPGACDRCAFRPVCGPFEEHRARGKDPVALRAARGRR